jgi:hypothetical protein
VVFVALNRGYRYRRKAVAEDTDRRESVFYVFPVGVIQEAQNPDSAWDKVFLKHIENSGKYVSDWDAIREFLSG